MLKDRKKGQRSTFCAGGKCEKKFCRKFGGIAPIQPAGVECQRSSGVPWWISRVLVAPSGG